LNKFKDEEIINKKSSFNMNFSDENNIPL